MIVHSYVYLSSQLHLIVTALDEEGQNGSRDFKKFTSKKLIKAITENKETIAKRLLWKFSYETQKSEKSKNYKVWQDGFHPSVKNYYHLY